MAQIMTTVPHGSEVTRPQRSYTVQALSVPESLAKSLNTTNQTAQRLHIAGVVQQITGQNVQIETAQGRVTLRTQGLPSFLLKSGRPVLLKIPLSQTPLSLPLSITLTHARTGPATTPPQQSAGRTPQTAGGGQLRGQTGAVQQEPGTGSLRGLLIAPTQQQSHTAGLPSLPGGAVLSLVPQAPQPSQSSASLPSSPSLLPHSSPSLLPHSSPSLLPHSSPSLLPHSSPTERGPLITATALKQSAEGVIFQTPLGQVLVPGLSSVAPGDDVVFRLILSPTQKDTTQKYRPSLKDTLTQIHALLFAVGQGAAVTNSIPQPGTRLTSQLLFFLKALQITPQDVFEKLPLFHVLKKLKENTLRQNLLRELPGRSLDTPTGEWRGMTIPLWIDNQPQSLFFAIKDHTQQDDASTPQEKVTRFQLELTLDTIGDLQMDGLVKQKRLDLVIRTKTALSEKMRQDIHRLFTDSVQATGYKGSLHFEQLSHWVSLRGYAAQNRQHST